MMLKRVRQRIRRCASSSKQSSTLQPDLSTLCQVSTPHRLPYQAIFSVALWKLFTGRFVSSTQFIASLPGGGSCSVAATTFTLIGSNDAKAFAWPRWYGGLVHTLGKRPSWARGAAARLAV